ncbi:MAG: hypothetical protein ACXWUR_07075 [Allosphingosinicella sp.]
MNKFDMIAFVVLMVMLASIVKTVFRYRADKKFGRPISDEPEVRQLRDDVRALKERMSVLERITVEKENSLAREIENLRDRAPS